jgi:hypothetical protein
MFDDLARKLRKTDRDLYPAGGVGPSVAGIDHSPNHTARDPIGLEEPDSEAGRLGKDG